MAAIWTGTVVEQVIGALKNEKISAGVMVALIAIAWWAHSWAEEEFVKKGEFNRLQAAVDDGFESVEINNAGQVIRDIKLEILITKATQGSDKELADLADELKHAQAYKACLVKQEPNCQHLKEVE